MEQSIIYNVCEVYCWFLFMKYVLNHEPLKGFRWIRNISLFVSWNSVVKDELDNGLLMNAKCPVFWLMMYVANIIEQTSDLLIYLLNDVKDNVYDESKFFFFIGLNVSTRQTFTVNAKFYCLFKCWNMKKMEQSKDWYKSETSVYFLDQYEVLFFYLNVESVAKMELTKKFRSLWS